MAAARLANLRPRRARITLTKKTKEEIDTMKPLQVIPYLDDKKVPDCTRFEIRGDTNHFVTFVLTESNQQLLSVSTADLKFKVESTVYNVGKVAVDIMYLDSATDGLTEVTLRLSN